MTWIKETPLSYFQQFCVNILKCGPIPQHLAIIMDGNRRFAQKTHVEKTIGHSKGFEKLSETLQWCKEIGINEVTVYAFSIENFKRSSEEVKGLMQLAKEKFEKLLEEEEKLMENGICIRIIGNLSLLPDNLKKLFAKAMLITKNNKNFFLNVAFAYTSRDEITNAISSVVKGVKSGCITREDIDEELLTNCMYTCNSPPPDLYIRTSGEVRFSDFLLWQNGGSVLYFIDVLWPEFTFWNFLKTLLHYQRQNFKQPEKICPKFDTRVEEFLKFVKKERMSELELYANA